MKYDEWNEWKNTNPWLISTNSGLAGTPVLTRSTNLFDGITDIAIILVSLGDGLLVDVKGTAAVYA